MALAKVAAGPPLSAGSGLSSLSSSRRHGLSPLPLRQARGSGSSSDGRLRRSVALPSSLLCSAGDSDLLLLLLVDPWAPGVLDMDPSAAASSASAAFPQSMMTAEGASQLFAASLFPYLAFLFHITRSRTAPKLTLFGFYFLLAFVFATSECQFPAGIYAKLRYGTSLANVDWLHGSAESLLTLTNLFIVLGLRKALREPTIEANAESLDDMIEDETA